MTRTIMSQKICEAISAVFGRTTQNPENWLYEQDYVRGHVSFTESAASSRCATALCIRLEEMLGPGVKVSSTTRAADAYTFTIDFEGAKNEDKNGGKNESKYTDGKTTLSTIEQGGKTVITDGTPEGTLAVNDPDKFVDGLNKVTGSHFRKAEELLDERTEQANLALDGTGYAIKREDNCLRVTGPKPEALAPLCNFIPEGDEYYGSGIETRPDGSECVVLVIPPEIFGVEELLAFIDKAAGSLMDSAEQPEPKTDVEWSDAINAAEPDPAMARRFNFLKNVDGLSLALSDEKFAQAVASVRDVFGNAKAEAVLTLRLGARMARAIVERLGAPKKSESFAGSHGGKASPGVSAIIAGHMVTRK